MQMERVGTCNVHKEWFIDGWSSRLKGENYNM
jgi:hypothetical protein